MNDARNLGTIHACATETEALAVQAIHGGTIREESWGRPVWVVHALTAPEAKAA